MKTTAGILRAAFGIIKQRGWTQGFLEDNNGRVCLIGALHLAGGAESANDTPRDPRDWLAYKAARDALARHLGFASTWGAGNLTNWNDTPGRRVAEVRAALQAAADEAERAAAARG